MAVRAVALRQAHDRSLTDRPGADSARLELLLVHEPRGTTDVGLVYLDFALKLPEPSALHGEPNAVQHEPAGFLRDTKRPRHFVGADPVLVVDDHPHGGQPLVQADGRILENGPNLDAELRARVLRPALPTALVGQERDGGTAALRARDIAIRPG